MSKLVPLISIIVPAYNNATTLPQALESLLLQTYQNIEIIVVDDYSTDHTEEVIEPFLARDQRISYIKNALDDPYRINRLGVNINAGYQARNLGIDHARGDMITFQDADDASLANRIEIQYTFLKQYDALHCVANYQDFDATLIGASYQKTISKDEILLQKDIEVYLRKSPAVPQFLRDPHSYRKENSTPIRSLKRMVRNVLLHEPIPYPYSGNTAMVAREVIEHARFRPLWERQWPSHKGRGADMDFNYNVVRTFRKSIAVNAPLYLWRRQEMKYRKTGHS